MRGSSVRMPSGHKMSRGQALVVGVSASAKTTVCFFYYSVSSFAFNPFFCSSPNIQTYTAPPTNNIIIHNNYMGIHVIKNIQYN